MSVIPTTSAGGGIGGGNDSSDEEKRRKISMDIGGGPCKKDALATPLKKRGRPRKIPADTPLRKRGRPRKIPAATATPSAAPPLRTNNTPIPSPAPKKRGRPKKTFDDRAAAFSVPPKKRGRPSAEDGAPGRMEIIGGTSKTLEIGGTSTSSGRTILETEKMKQEIDDVFDNLTPLPEGELTGALRPVGPTPGQRLVFELDIDTVGDVIRPAPEGVDKKEEDKKQ